MQRADNADVQWEPGKKRWEVHIHAGAEVIKRPVPKHLSDTGEEALREQAISIAKDEGYDLDRSHVAVMLSPDHPV
jgi:hypothetical protein